MTRYTEFLLFLALHTAGFFLEYLYSYQMELVQIKRRVCQKKPHSGGVSIILRSGLILENIQRMFMLLIWATGTMYMNFDKKHSPNVLENQTRLQNSAYTARKSSIFRILCGLFE